MWFGLAGWGLLLFCFFRRPESKLYALFFYSTLFHASGYFSNPLFSLKHLHVALALSVLAGWRRDRPVETLTEGARNRFLWLVYGVWMVAALTGFFPFSMKAVKVSFNWALVLIFTTYLLGLLKRMPEYLKTALFFFVFGIILQCLAGYYNAAAGWALLDSSIANNNHLALLLCFGLFYALWLYLTETANATKVTLFLSFILMLLTLVLTLSRTGWISFLFHALLFAGFAVTNQEVPRSAKLRLTLIFGLLLFLVDICMMRPDFMERLFSIEWLVSGQYLREHGDFFGRFRPGLIRQVFNASPVEWALGRGFQHWITDIHSLYLVIFSASGIMGLALFFTFIFGLFFRLFHLVRRPSEWRSTIFYLSALCAFSSWLLTSVMATLFLQFYVWTMLAVALFALTGKNERIPDRP